MSGKGRGSPVGPERWLTLECSSVGRGVSGEGRGSPACPERWTPLPDSSVGREVSGKDRGSPVNPLLLVFLPSLINFEPEGCEADDSASLPLEGIQTPSGTPPSRLLFDCPEPFIPFPCLEFEFNRKGGKSAESLAVEGFEGVEKSAESLPDEDFESIGVGEVVSDPREVLIFVALFKESGCESDMLLSDANLLLLPTCPVATVRNIHIYMKLCQRTENSLVTFTMHGYSKLKLVDSF